MNYKDKNVNKRQPVKKSSLGSRKRPIKSKIETKTIKYKNSKAMPESPLPMDFKAKNKKKFSNVKINYSTIAVLAIFFMVVGLYILGGIFELANKSDISTISVDYDGVNHPDIYSGIIIRDENVYKSTATGTISFNYDNQDKVAKGTAVCVIQNQEEVAKLTKDLETSNQEILVLQEKRGEMSAFNQESQRANLQIQNIVDNSIRNLSANGFSEVYKLKENVEQSMDIRNQMLLSENKGSVKDLVDEKNNLVNQLNENIAVINSENGGILSYYIDGQEEALTVENMKNITTEQTKMKVDYDELKTIGEVVPEQNIFKIIESNVWYIAVYAPNNVVSDWAMGDTRNLYLEKNDEYTKTQMYVENIKPGQSESLIILKSSKNMIDYLDTRNISIKLASESGKGIKIPTISIVDKTLLVIPNNFVYKPEDPYVLKKNLENNPDQTVPVKISSKDNMNTYIFKDESSNLNISDVLIKNDDKSKEFVISEVKNIKGVFLYDNGYADFVEVDLGTNASDLNVYVFLDIELNNNLPANSRIITDPKNIQDGDKLQ